MPKDLVLWETRGAVTTLTLNRPEALNALSPELASQFEKSVGRIAKEPSKVVVLAGSGQAFCAGGDFAFIKGNTRVPKERLAPLMRRFYGSFLRLRGLPQVTIARVNGAAVGAGLCLALACDLRTVLASARLSLNFVRLGLGPGMGAWPLARAAFGDSRARELLLSGRFFSGRELHAWGAAAAVGEDPDDLASRTEALSRELAANSPLALRLLKEEMRLGEGLDSFLALEARTQAASFKGPDLLEGLAAAKERRAPRF